MTSRDGGASSPRVRYAVVRVEYPDGTGDHDAIALTDQLCDFGRCLGDVYILDEGVGDPTKAESA